MCAVPIFRAAEGAVMVNNLIGVPGAHPWLEVAYWVSQITIAFVAGVGAVYAFRQVRALQLFELLRFIQTERMMELRRSVRKDIGPIRMTNWWEDRKLEAVASIVASSYDVLGAYLRVHGPRSMRKFVIAHLPLRASVCQLYAACGIGIASRVRRMASMARIDLRRAVSTTDLMFA
jgi:hypothetical protein